MAIRMHVHRRVWAAGVGPGGLADRMGWFVRPTSWRDRVRRGIWIAVAIAVLVPLALLIVAAGIAATLIFLTLALVGRILAAILPRRVPRPTPGAAADDGRRNVTVIHPTSPLDS